MLFLTDFYLTTNFGIKLFELSMGLLTILKFSIKFLTGFFTNPGKGPYFLRVPIDVTDVGESILSF